VAFWNVIYYLVYNVYNIHIYIHINEVSDAYIDLLWFIIYKISKYYALHCICAYLYYWEDEARSNDIVDDIPWVYIIY